MNTSMPVETPRTSKLHGELPQTDDTIYESFGAMSKHACDLERELIAATRERDEASDNATHWLKTASELQAECGDYILRAEKAEAALEGMKEPSAEMIMVGVEKLLTPNVDGTYEGLAKRIYRAMHEIGLERGKWR